MLPAFQYFDWYSRDHPKLFKKLMPGAHQGLETVAGWFRV